MKKVATAKLKASLSEYLAKVRKGEEVVVTDRGRPVAKLIPFCPKGGGRDERAGLSREGIIEPGRSGSVPVKFLKASPVNDRKGLLLKALFEEREEQP